jgi:hypothetical protein
VQPFVSHWFSSSTTERLRMERNTSAYSPTPVGGGGGGGAKQPRKPPPSKPQQQQQQQRLLVCTPASC